MNSSKNAIKPFTEKYDLSDDQINAAKHATVAAVYSDLYGSTQTLVLGELFELCYDGRDDSKDIFNNEMGVMLQNRYPGLSVQQYAELAAILAKNDALQLLHRIPPSLEDGFFDHKLRKFEKTLSQNQDAISVLEKPPLQPEGKCFSAGTMISMWDGSTKPIEGIRPGDIVLSFDPASGEPVPGTVSRTNSH